MLLDLASAREATGDVDRRLRPRSRLLRSPRLEAGDAQLAARAEAGAARHVVMWIDDPDRRRRLEEAAQRLPPGDHPLRVDLYGRLAVLVPGASRASVRRGRGGATTPLPWRAGSVILQSLASALIDRHLAPITSEDLAAHADVADELLAAAERSGRADLVLVALQWQYAARIARADLAGAHAAVVRLEALAAVMPSPLWRYGALLRRAIVHALAGERELALECIDDAWSLGAASCLDNSGVARARRRRPLDPRVDLRRQRSAARRACSARRRPADAERGRVLRRALRATRR